MDDRALVRAVRRVDGAPSEDDEVERERGVQRVHGDVRADGVDGGEAERDALEGEDRPEEEREEEFSEGHLQYPRDVG